MTEENGAVNSGGFFSAIDWTDPIPGSNLKDYVHHSSSFTDDDDDEDDIDSYYMDYSPIDMAERLKEVNKALADDSTPIDCNRVTKLRFKEVIAEYQSLRESDSDDGYGDSSEIMFDAEDENDIIYSATPLQDGVSTSEPRFEPSERAGNSQDLENDVGSYPPTDTSNPSGTCRVTKQMIEATSINPSLPERKIEPGLKLLLKEQTQPSMTKEKVTGNGHHPRPLEGSEEIEPLILSDFDTQRPEDDEVFVENEEEITEEIEEDCVVEEETSVIKGDDKLGLPESLLENNAPISEEVKLNGEVNVSIKGRLSIKRNDPLVSNKTTHDSEKGIQMRYEDCVKTTAENADPKSPLNSREKKSVQIKLNTGNKAQTDQSQQKPSQHKPEKKEKRSISSRFIPSIKPSLNPYEITNSLLREPRNRKDVSRTLNLSQPKSYRPRLNASNCSPTKSPIESSIPPAKSRREIRARKGSPDPRRIYRNSEKNPVKAIHNHTTASWNSVDKSEFNKEQALKTTSHYGGVRKAASTSDLSSSPDNQSNVNKEVYEKWLQQKNREAAITRRQIEESRAMEMSRAATKVQDRKRVAEEAFQQWLRRKRDQLRMEKKMKQQQRKLDHHANYASTRAQCEEAYNEWWKRKTEELNATRASGNASVRSRSLERMWVQEKTRKLYNTYLPKR